MARILYIITSSGVGGAELALWQLLRRLDRSRWEPTVVSLKPPGEIAARIRALGIEVLSPGVGDETGAFAALELLLEARRLPRLLGGRRFDLVHSLLFRANLLARLAAPRLGRPRDGQRRPHQPRGGAAVAAARRPLDPRPGHPLSLAALPALAAALQQRLGVAAGRCVVDPERRRPRRGRRGAGRRRGRRRAGSSASSRPDIAIACVGRLHARRASCTCSAPSTRCCRCSRPRGCCSRATARRAARSRRPVGALRLGPFVRFLGTVADPWPLLAAADIFALPSLWEGMPNALLEAMAAGLPAVATAVGAVPEMVVDGREALLVPPGDAGALARALAELAAWPARRREMGALARRRVEDAYRIEATVAQTERLYDELLAAPGRAG